MTLEQRLVDLAGRIRNEVRAVRRETTHGTAQCPVGWGIDAYTVLSTGTAQMSSTIRNQVRLMPVDTGPRTQTFDAMQTSVTVAESGGAGVVHQMGLYRSDTDDAVPLLNGGLLALTEVTLTAIGARLGTFATPVTLTPGRYWIAWLSRWTTQPTTLATVFRPTNALNLPRPMSAHGDGSSRCFVVGGQANGLPNDLSNPTIITSGDSLMPHVLMRRSA